MSPRATSHPAPQLPNYSIIELLYSGSRTVVYRAIDNQAQLPVVIKLLQHEFPSFNDLLHFRNQFSIARNLDFPGIVRPLALLPYRNSYALVMEDCGATCLQNVAKQPLSLQQVLEIALQLADILHHLHHNRVIHKDIKPANLLIQPQSQQIKLIDFSIASLLPKETQEIKNPKALEGTLAYLAPEQTGRMNRGIDYRADFYALGVTLFELLAGQLPFCFEDPIELVHAHLAVQPPLLHQLADVPVAVSEIVAKLMAKNAEARYQSALGFKHDLQHCLTQLQKTGQIQTFVLATQDISDRFLIPEKLYGRESEVQQLLDAFERVARGASELMLVAGFSGIGKTAVVNEVHKPITRQQGYFIKGKFDQFNRNIPFSAFVQAFHDLMGQLLSESDAQLETWKTLILNALGENAPVIIEIIPELERIIGPQPPAPELSGIAAQNRFNLLLHRFIQVFTTPEHPLVMFLDDLQWADSASLNLMQLLLQDTETEYLLVIGAYRDNEVFAAHPLMLMLDTVATEATVNTMRLQPLSQPSLNQLVAETLHCTETSAQPLAELVFQKTQGNPFFATQFLKALHQEALIHFDVEARHWQCDIVRVREAALTDDVVEFMALQIQKLPPATQQVLTLAACIGNQFDLSTLAIVSEQSQVDAATALWKALQEGLVIPQNQVYKFYLDDQQGSQADAELNLDQTMVYRFLHDRVQQAAYSLIPEDQKQATHYQIGNLLLSNLSDAEREEKIFDIVNQINMGKSLIHAKHQKQQLAELNLNAGRKAKASTAYDAAKAYLQQGIDLLHTSLPGSLSSHSGTETYRLAYDLYFNLAEAALLSGEFQRSEATMHTLLKFADSKIDRARIYVLRVTHHSLQGQFAESIQAGLEGLSSLGITIDRESLGQLVQAEFEAVEASLNDRAIASLIDLPTAANLEVEAAIELLIILQPPAYIVSDFNLYSFATFRAVRLSIEQGNTTESVKAYASYGFLIGVMYSQYQRGMEFADLALQLSYKLNSKFQQSRACFMLSSAIQVWAKPIQGAAETNYQGFLAGLESGEIIHAGYNLYGNILNRLFQGENLADIAIDLDKFWLIGEKLKHDFLLSILEASRFFINQLTQVEQSESIAAAEAWVERYEATQSHTALGTYHILQMHRACLISGAKPAIDYLTKAVQSLQGCAGFTTSAGYYYYGSLILLDRYSNLPEAERSGILQQIETNQTQLRAWANSCSENFLHKYLLIEAERSRISGNRLETLELYDQAIFEAKTNGYLQEEALSNELAAKFYLSWGKEKVAAGYMQEAYYCYARWGAKAKTNALEHHYPELLRPILQQTTSLNPLETIASLAAPNISIHSSTAAGQSSSTINTALDFAALLKASQSLSSTIQLNQLLHQLTQIILQHSGGDRCALILPNRSGEWQIQAVATTEAMQFCSLSLNDDVNLPIKLIQYVKNTQEVIVIDQLKTNLPILDQCLIQQQPQSILCLPILNQGKLLGILYLTNQATAGAFTNDHILILNFLCTQAAISLENARLYQEAQANAQQLEQALDQQKILFNVVTQMRESLDIEAIFQTVTQNVRSILNVDRVGIYQFHLDQNCEYGEFIAEDVSSSFPSALEVKVQDHCFGENYAALYKQGRICAISDVDAAEIPDCHRAILVQFAIKASLVVPILQDNNLWGLLCIHQCDRPRPWQAAESQFAQQIAAQMGIALQQTELLLETRRQAHQLEQTLQHLQQTQLQMVQSEKMASLGNLVAGVAHEINNPIGFLNGSINNAKDYVQDLLDHLELYQNQYPNPEASIQDHTEAVDLKFLCEDLPAVLTSMQGATDRIKAISTSLRTFSRADTDRKVSANLHEGLDSTLMILKYRLKANEFRPAIQIAQNYKEFPPIDCFPGQLNQVFMNILANAIDMFDDLAQQSSFTELEAHPQTITIETSISTENRVEIQISDNGKGMSDAVKARAFDHLFTTKGVGKGTGLGLAIARQIIVEKHGGTIAVESELGAGTTFLISLPI